MLLNKVADRTISPSPLSVILYRLKQSLLKLCFLLYLF